MFGWVRCLLLSHPMVFSVLWIWRFGVVSSCVPFESQRIWESACLLLHLSDQARICNILIWWLLSKSLWWGSRLMHEDILLSVGWMVSCKHLLPFHFVHGLFSLALVAVPTIIATDRCHLSTLGGLVYATILVWTLVHRDSLSMQMKNCGVACIWEFSNTDQRVLLQSWENIGLACFFRQWWKWQFRFMGCIDRCAVG